MANLKDALNLPLTSGSAFSLLKETPMQALELDALGATEGSYKLTSNGRQTGSTIVLRDDGTWVMLKLVPIVAPELQQKNGGE